MGIYIGSINLEVDGIEGPGGGQTEDSFTEESVDAIIGATMLIEQRDDHVAKDQGHKSTLSSCMSACTRAGSRSRLYVPLDTMFYVDLNPA